MEVVASKLTCCIICHCHLCLPCWPSLCGYVQCVCVCVCCGNWWWKVLYNRVVLLTLKSINTYTQEMAWHHCGEALPGPGPSMSRSVWHQYCQPSWPLPLMLTNHSHVLKIHIIPTLTLNSITYISLTAYNADQSAVLHPLFISMVANSELLSLIITTVSVT